MPDIKTVSRENRIIQYHNVTSDSEGPISCQLSHWDVSIGCSGSSCRTWQWDGGGGKRRGAGEI